MTPRIVFLMYHELELPGRTLVQDAPGYVRYVLHAAKFREQMELIKQQGWRGVGVSEALNFSPHEVAITFDDGCETDLISAAPILREFGFGATFYITTGFLGKPGYLNHAQLRELAESGWEIGCHSMTHAYLTDLDDQGLHREIVEAKLQLEQIVGRVVEHFSCPGGRYDLRVANTARRAGYRRGMGRRSNHVPPAHPRPHRRGARERLQPDAARARAVCHGSCGRHR